MSVRYTRPAWQDSLQADVFSRTELAAPAEPGELAQAVTEIIAAPNMASKSWVTDQYDRYVQGNTALAMPEDAGVIRVDENSGLGVAVSTDANGRYSYLDPYAGAQLALAQAYRNVATVGAKPLAVTDCLNFGSPEDPEVMWQFAETVRGLADACLELGIPVTGGNVSLYNQTGGVAIQPTPVVGVLGVFDDVLRRTPAGWREDGQAIYLLGATRGELDGSEWARLRGHLGGLPPQVDLAAEKLLGEILVNASRDGMIDAAHDVAEGGLAATLVESALRFGVGARIGLAEVGERDGVDLFTMLFSESQGRAIVSVPRSEEVRFVDMCTARGQAHIRIGVVDSEDDQLLINGVEPLPLADLRAAHEGTLPALFS